MKKSLLLVIVGLIVTQSHAQDSDSKNRLTFNFGPSLVTRQDLIFSPNIHTDFTMLNFGLEYIREANLFQKVQLNYANYNPMVLKPYDFTEYGEPETAYPHSFNFIDLDYHIGKKLQETEKSALTVGGLFSANIQATSYVYGLFSNLGYYSALDLGIFASEKYKLTEKSYLTATIQLPLMAWLSRSPYLVNDDEFIENISSHSGFKSFTSFIGDGELATWNKLQTFDLNVKYTYNLTDKWDVGMGYAFEFIHSSQPRNLLSFRNTLNLFATIKF